MTRIALLIVALAAAAWLASGYPGARDEARAVDVGATRGATLNPEQSARAIELLQGARRARPDGDVVPRLAGLYAATGRRDDALALLRRLVRDEPDNIGAWAVLEIALAPVDPQGAAAARAHRRALAPPVK